MEPISIEHLKVEIKSWHYFESHLFVTFKKEHSVPMGDALAFILERRPSGKIQKIINDGASGGMDNVTVIFKKEKVTVSWWTRLLSLVDTP